MGFFGVSTDDTISDEVDSATSEENVEEDWGLIMKICDNAGNSTEEARQYLKVIGKKLCNTDPHVGVKAVTLLDACVKNSGKTFHVEMASREFENEFNRLMTKAHPTVAKKLRESLKKWAENEFKSDDQLRLIPSLYAKLKSSGLDFSSTEIPAKVAPICKDPNVVESQEEEDQILKAIELSLKESGSPRPTSAVQPTLYPSVSLEGASALPAPNKEPRKVRALYDFEAAEDNELTFTSGEILLVIDDSDTNWWKGSNHRGEGLFPANFVTADLSVEPEKLLFEQAKQMAIQDTEASKDVKEENVEIKEQKIDRVLHFLHEADPTNPDKDSEEMITLEREVTRMGPKIDMELEMIDRKHAQLTQLSGGLVEALSLYHSLMREPQYPTYASKVQFPYQPGPPPPLMYGHLPPNMPEIKSPPGFLPGQERPTFMIPAAPGHGRPTFAPLGAQGIERQIFMPPRGQGHERPNFLPHGGQTHQAFHTMPASGPSEMQTHQQGTPQISQQQMAPQGPRQVAPQGPRQVGPIGPQQVAPIGPQQVGPSSVPFQVHMEVQDHAENYAELIDYPSGSPMPYQLFPEPRAARDAQNGPSQQRANNNHGLH